MEAPLSSNGEAGRCKADLTNEGSGAEVYAYGSHATGWTSKDGVQRLYMSSKAEHQDGAHTLTDSIALSLVPSPGIFSTSLYQHLSLHFSLSIPQHLISAFQVDGCCDGGCEEVGVMV